MRHETIYPSLLVKGRGESQRELTRCLRSGRTKRRPHGRAPASGQRADMVVNSKLTPDVEERSVPGHWERDITLGKAAKNTVGTLAVRQTP